MDTENSPQENNEVATAPIFRTDGVVELPQSSTWTVRDEKQEETGPVVLDEPEEQSEEKSEIKAQEERESEHDEESDEKKKKKRNTSQQRIIELNRKLNETKNFAQQITTQNNDLQKKLAFAQQEALSNYEKLLNSDKERIKAAKINALEENDTARITETDDLMSQYNAALLEVKKRKETLQQEKYQELPQIPQEMYQESPDYPEEEIDEDVHHAADQWMKQNPWADVNSNYFDNEMFNEADEYSAKLKRRYVLEKRSEEIGLPSFWDEVTDYMHDQYSVSNKNEPEPKNRNFTMKNTHEQKVAPVSRKPQSNSYNQKKQIILSDVQKEMARSLRGFIRDKNGTPITDNKTLESIYARNLG